MRHEERWRALASEARAVAHEMTDSEVKRALPRPTNNVLAGPQNARAGGRARTSRSDRPKGQIGIAKDHPQLRAVAELAAPAK